MIDIYSTREPQLAFHQRISFCLDIHNMSVKVRGPGLQRRCLAATCPPPHPRVPQGRLAWFGAQFPDDLCKTTGCPEGAEDCLWDHSTFPLLFRGLVAREGQTGIQSAVFWIWFQV